MNALASLPGLRRILAVAVLVAAAFAAAPAAAGEAFTPDQEKAVGEVVRQYLLDHPEVIMKAIDALLARQAQAENRQSRTSLSSARDEIERDPDTPVVGNPDGDVTMVEFFDYRCGFCKRVLPTVRKMLEIDGKIRLVLKEFPILGPDSVVAARAALAAWKLDPAKYMDFHVALMSTRGALDKTKVLIVAARTGYDADAVAEGMTAPWIDAAIDRNKNLASRLGINGTPAFIIGDVLIPGAADQGTLERALAKARGS